MSVLRRPVLWLAIGVVLATGTFLVVTREEPALAQATDLGTELREVAAGLHADDPYRPPEPAERRRVLAALHALEAGKPASAPGFTARTGTDKATGRPYGLLVNPPDERAWGWYLVDRSAPPRLVIE